MPATSRPFTFDRVVRILAGAALAVGAIWLINVLRNVLLPFALACLIAYLLEPLVGVNQRFLHLKGRVIASLLTLLEVAIVIVLLAYLFIPSIINEIHQLDVMIHSGSGRAVNVPLLPPELLAPIKEWITDFNINKFINSEHFESILDSGTSFVAGVINFLLHTLEWLLTFIYVIFILIDYQSVMIGSRMLVPKKYRRIVFRIGNDIKNSMNHYFRGQALIALCAAVLYSIGFSIVGIPLAIVLGIIVGILYMIPYFQYVTLIPVALVCLIQSLGGDVGFWPELGKCLLVYVVSQCVCDYVLTPKIMGKAMGLNPAVILLSLSVWGTLMGLIGMIIALPLTTLLLAYYQEFVINCGGKDQSKCPPADDGTGADSGDSADAVEPTDAEDAQPATEAQ